MKVQAMPDADFDLVFLHTGYPEIGKTPHCKNHGAMNKISRFKDGGGYWRCLAVHSVTKIINGNSVSYKENDTVCRAGCQQILTVPSLHVQKE